MTNHFNLSIPNVTGSPTNINLSQGDVLYILGANGTGKSSLITSLFNQNHAQAKRISAHRQTWFESNALALSPQNRVDLEVQFRSQDVSPRARYWEWNPSGRASVAIFDLIDADTMQERKIANLVRSDDIEGARIAAAKPSPIQQINELMRLSNLPVAIQVVDGQKIVAQKHGGASYSVAELSDGERNAFLIAADVLTAKSGTLILIDEPERHLHRAITSPLLKLLFDRRKDCAFIVSTHELLLAQDTPEASVLLVRSCEYVGQQVRAWTADLLPPGIEIDDDLKGALIGSRRKMIFVEGTHQSLDVPFYSLLFPQVSIVPKGSCRDVENAVHGLRGASNIHWVSVWGIVDNDQRDPEDIARLRNSGIYALSHYSVESLYYHEKVIARIAKRQGAVTGSEPAALSQLAISDAIAAAGAQKTHLTTSAVVRAVRRKILEFLPNTRSLQGETTLNIELDIARLRNDENRTSTV